MPDVLTPEQRRRCMSSVRGSNTKPELLLRKALWHKGLRYRLKSELPGKPDIVLSCYKIVIFVDGCYWHSCPEHGSLPETNKLFWKNKIARNVERDHEVNVLLEQNGWRVIRIWEHEIKQSLEEVIEKIYSALSVSDHVTRRYGVNSISLL